MNPFQTQYLRNVGESSAALRDTLDGNLERYQALRVRTFALNIGGAWHNGLTVGKMFSKDQTLEHKSSLRYATFRLLEHWVDAKDLPSFIAAISSGKASIDGTEVLFSVGDHISSREMLVRNNDYDAAAGFLLRAEYKGGAVGRTSDPL